MDLLAPSVRFYSGGREWMSLLFPRTLSGWILYAGFRHRAVASLLEKPLWIVLMSMTWIFTGFCCVGIVGLSMSWC